MVMSLSNVVKTMPVAPPMTGNGFYIAPFHKNGDDWGMVQMALLITTLDPFSKPIDFHSPVAEETTTCSPVASA